MNPQISQLAGEFTLELSSCLSASEVAEMIALNSAESNPSICHSHDFCDANEAMSAAFLKVFGRECVACDDADLAVMNAAWDFAKVEWQKSAVV